MPGRLNQKLVIDQTISQILNSGQIAISNSSERYGLRWTSRHHWKIEGLKPWEMDNYLQQPKVKVYLWPYKSKVNLPKYHFSSRSEVKDKWGINVFFEKLPKERDKFNNPNW